MQVYTIQDGETCYIFQAALLCEACGEHVRAQLTAAGKAPDDPDNENTYDSDDFPKGPYDAEGEDACDRMDQCLSLAL